MAPGAWPARRARRATRSSTASRARRLVLLDGEDPAEFSAPSPARCRAELAPAGALQADRSAVIVDRHLARAPRRPARGGRCSTTFLDASPLDAVFPTPSADPGRRRGAEARHRADPGQPWPARVRDPGPLPRLGAGRAVPCHRPSSKMLQAVDRRPRRRTPAAGAAAGKTKQTRETCREQRVSSEQTVSTGAFPAPTRSIEVPPGQRSASGAGRMPQPAAGPTPSNLPRSRAVRPPPDAGPGRGNQQGPVRPRRGSFDRRRRGDSKNQTRSGGSPVQLSRDELLKAYRQMRTIREFEDAVHAEFAAGNIPGFVHLYAGEEASAVGVCMHLTTTTGSPRPIAAMATASPRAATSRA